MTGLLLTLHVLGACVWTGGHLVLALAVLPRALAAGDGRALHEFDDRFEKLAVPALLVQVATGFALAWSARPEPSTWLGFSDTLAAHVTLKLLLLLGTVALALDARLRLARAPLTERARLRSMAVHVVAVTVLAVALVVVGVSAHVGAPG
jgi:putative copper export protein